MKSLDSMIGFTNERFQKISTLTRCTLPLTSSYVNRTLVMPLCITLRSSETVHTSSSDGIRDSSSLSASSSDIQHTLALVSSNASCSTRSPSFCDSGRRETQMEDSTPLCVRFLMKTSNRYYTRKLQGQQEQFPSPPKETIRSQHEWQDPTQSTWTVHLSA